MRGREKIVPGATSHRAPELQHRAKLMEADQARAMIERRFPLQQVPAAQRYFEPGPPSPGEVVVTLDRSVPTFCAAPREGAVSPVGLALAARPGASDPPSLS
ncbi:MAG TPA: hypothetical protein VN842_01915 [Thermoplasmata archaeon]|nr:hypothetical protein [Thermoplasmata archaeon]